MSTETSAQSQDKELAARDHVINVVVYATLRRLSVDDRRAFYDDLQSMQTLLRDSGNLISSELIADICEACSVLVLPEPPH